MNGNPASALTPSSLPLEGMSPNAIKASALERGRITIIFTYEANIGLPVLQRPSEDWQKHTEEKGAPRKDASGRQKQLSSVGY